MKSKTRRVTKGPSGFIESMKMEPTNRSSTAIPFWRDVRVLRVIAQVVFVIVILLIA